MSDEDWFERALREGEEDGDGERELADADDGAGAGGDPFEESAGDESDESEDSPFDQDFASALGSAPDPSTGDVSGGDTSGEDPFGGDTSGEDPFGGGSGGGGDPFGGGGGGGGDPFGGGGGGGDPFSGAEFDEEEFDSELARVDVGVEGLDDMILGGLPERTLMAVMGSAGTGKTTFGLQFLHHRLVDGGRGVYITLEENRQRVIETADEKGWEFSEYAANDQLAVVDLDPVEMANSLASIRNDLPRLIDDFGADRLVLDSVSLLEMMYDHPARRRSEVFEFTRSLKSAGVTTMVTSEASHDHAYVSKHGIIEYLADAVFVLQYVRGSDFQETRLAIEIQKIRDANHSRATKPYDITDDGISVHRQANIF